MLVTFSGRTSAPSIRPTLRRQRSNSTVLSSDSFETGGKKLNRLKSLQNQAQEAWDRLANFNNSNLLFKRNRQVEDSEQRMAKKQTALKKKYDTTHSEDGYWKEIDGKFVHFDSGKSTPVICPDEFD